MTIIEMIFFGFIFLVVLMETIILRRKLNDAIRRLNLRLDLQKDFTNSLHVSILNLETAVHTAVSEKEMR